MIPLGRSIALLIGSARQAEWSCVKLDTARKRQDKNKNERLAAADEVRSTKYQYKKIWYGEQHLAYNVLPTCTSVCFLVNRIEVELTPSWALLLFLLADSWKGQGVIGSNFECPLWVFVHWHPRWTTGRRLFPGRAWSLHVFLRVVGSCWNKCSEVELCWLKLR